MQYNLSNAVSIYLWGERTFNQIEEIKINKIVYIIIILHNNFMLNE